MGRIRTTKQATKLRPLAIERARQSKFHIGDEVFYGGISWARTEIWNIYDTKPHRTGLFRSVTNGSFMHGSLRFVYPDVGAYIASGVHYREAE